jgi:Pentapeptide repeats (9 copies)
LSGGLLLGRVPRELDDHATSGDNALYAAQLLDERTLDCAEFRHCTFANISFKAATLVRCRFLNCAFVDCYFRDTTLQNCSFEACKFEDCKFVAPNFLDCTFEFPEFRGCHIPYRFFREALPLDPGFRHGIADELAREAGAAGELRDARRYRLQGEQAYERHRWNLAWASGGAYYEKPRPPLDRVESALVWGARKFNRHLWGYGERGLILARSFVLTGGALFPLLFWLMARHDLSRDAQPLKLVDYELFSFDNLLNGTGFSRVSTVGTTARWIVGWEVFVGLVFIGLFISLVFNWVRRR